MGIEEYLEFKKQEKDLKVNFYEYTVTITVFSPNKPWNDCWHVKSQKVNALTALDALRVFRSDVENQAFLTCGSVEGIDIVCCSKK